MTKLIELLQSRLIELLAGVVWDVALGSYVEKGGGYIVAESTVLGWRDNYTRAVQGNISQITNSFVDGDITLQVWQQKMAIEIKDGWVVSSAIGRGGRNAMEHSDWGRVGGRLRFEYARLNNFAHEIDAGNLTDAMILARAKLYANATRTGYWDGLTHAKMAAGYTHEQRFLNPADHCDDCILYAALGVRPIGTLPEPGEACECMRNCKCTKEYTTPDEAGEEQWRPSMAREEADKWAAKSFWKDSVFHGTSSEGMYAIPDQGFDLDRMATGRMFGDGVYIGTTRSVAEGYAPPSQVLEAKVNVRNPFIADDWGSFSQMSDDGIAWQMAENIPVDTYADGITKYLQHMGYDSIYLPDNKFFIIFDPQNIVVIQ